MQTDRVVVNPPAFCHDLRFIEHVEQRAAQKLFPHFAIFFSLKTEHTAAKTYRTRARPRPTYSPTLSASIIPNGGLHVGLTQSDVIRHEG